MLKPPVYVHVISGVNNQISCCNILTNACKNSSQQNVLASRGLIEALDEAIKSPLADIQLPALQCVAFLVVNNRDIANVIKTKMLPRIVRLMDRNKKPEMQLAAARCVTYLFR